MNISLRQLQVFRAVARLRSFSRAGDEIGLTQPAVSRCVRELEAELGTRLLDRTTREVELTPVGLRFAGQLLRLLDELQLLLEEARKEGEQAHGTVHIASSPTLSASLLPGMLAQCAMQYPQIRPVLHDQVQRLNVESVRSGEVDFGIVVDPGESEDLECQPLLDDGFWLICRDDHPLASQSAVQWAQLQHQPLVLLDYSSGSRPIIDRILAQQQLECPVAQQMGHSSSVFQMVQAGLGISVSPGLALPLPAGSSLKVLPLLPVQQRTIMLVRRRQRSLSPVAEKVWQLVLQHKPQWQALVQRHLPAGLPSENKQAQT